LSQAEISIHFLQIEKVVPILVVSVVFASMIVMQFS
jgi:hypothetical protein